LEELDCLFFFLSCINWLFDRLCMYYTKSLIKSDKISYYLRIIFKMVYIEEWNKYQEAVEELYLNSPKVVKYFTFMIISSNFLRKIYLFPFWNIYTYMFTIKYNNSLRKKTRYVTSWRHSEGKLILKVTDDFTVLKYKTDQASDLKKFERLNRSLMLKMQNRKASESTKINFLLKSIFLNIRKNIFFNY